MEPRDPNTLPVGQDYLRRVAAKVGGVENRVDPLERMLAAKVSTPPTGTANGAVATADSTQPGLVAWRVIPSARVYNSTPTAITTGVPTKLAFDSERHDNATIHDNVTNNGRLTVPVAGVYHVFACVEFAPGSAAGTRQLNILVNGSTPIAIQTAPGFVGDSAKVTVSTLYKAALGDYFEVSVYQTSGGSVNISVGSNYSPEFGMTKIAEG